MCAAPTASSSLFGSQCAAGLPIRLFLFGAAEYVGSLRLARLHESNLLRRSRTTTRIRPPQARILRAACANVRAAFCRDNLRRRLFAWHQPLPPLRRHDPQWRGRSRCRARTDRSFRRTGALGRTSWPRQPQCVCVHGANSGAKPRARYWIRRSGQHQPLDARRHLWMAGCRGRLHRHLLDEHHAQYARVGRGRSMHWQ